MACSMIRRFTTSLAGDHHCCDPAPRAACLNRSADSAIAHRLLRIVARVLRQSRDGSFDRAIGEPIRPLSAINPQPVQRSRPLSFSFARSPSVSIGGKEKSRKNTKYTLGRCRLRKSVQMWGRRPSSVFVLPPPILRAREPPIGKPSFFSLLKHALHCRKAIVFRFYH